MPGEKYRPKPQSGSGSATVTPWGFLLEALKRVPSLKWAMGVGGIAAIIAIIGKWGLHFQEVAFGVPIFIALMTIYYVFVRITQLAGKLLRLPAVIFTYFATLLIMATLTFLFTSVFLGWPLALQHLIIGAQGG